MRLIYRLTHETETWIWVEETQSAFDRIKQLSVWVLLAFAPLCIQCDGNRYAFRIVLLQNDCATGYFSRTLTVCKEKYA